MSIAHLQPVDGTDRTLGSASSRVRSDSDAFKALLAESRRNQAERLSPTSQPVSKEKLLDIVRDIRMELDARLMQALTSETPEDIGACYLGLADRLTIPPSDPSNKPHVYQNSDATSQRGLIENAIRESARANAIDPSLVRSVIEAESNFNPNCTSPKGAMGLMQLMPETARELGVQNGYDPVENIEAGTRYLKMLLTRYNGNVPLALAAYNWGMGNIEKRPEQMPAETRRYVGQVTRRYAEMKV